MLWNWYTVDSCFLARSWHIRSHGAFAGSCIGVILLVIALEFLRRSQREYDAYLRKSSGSSTIERVNSDSENSRTGLSKSDDVRVRALDNRGSGYLTGGPRLKWWQHVIRSLLYMLQFAVGYFIMLLAMYYNGTALALDSLLPTLAVLSCTTSTDRRV